MDVVELVIPGVKLVRARRLSDDRGYFCETYSARSLLEHGLDRVFVQDNESFSRRPGTVRGLHYQAPPHEQAKLVRVTRGRSLDVAVDARRGSPTYGRWVGAELSEENGEQLFIPEGFLHGFVTREPDTIVQYKVSAPYVRESEGAVRWDDPNLGIDWGVARDAAVLSDKDATATAWADFVSPFAYAAR